MFKKWKPSFSFSVAYSPVNETQHESLLEPEEQNDIDFRLNNQQQKQFPLLIYWVCILQLA
jgi:hypothetical protein